MRVGPTLNGAPNGPHHRVIATPEDARQAVAELAADGVDLLKTHNATEREVGLTPCFARARVGGRRGARRAPASPPRWEADASLAAGRTPGQPGPREAHRPRNRGATPRSPSTV